MNGRREISTVIEIAAPAVQVWQALTDFSHYPEWNPFIQRIYGTPTLGTRIKFWFSIPPVRAFVCATILNVNPEVELRWAGGIRGLFRAEHYMRIERIDDTHVRFHHGEIFTGILVGLVWHLLLARRGPPVYQNTNYALQKRVQR